MPSHRDLWELVYFAFHPAFRPVANVMIVAMYLVERFILLRRQPLRRAGTPWPVALVTAVVLAQFSADGSIPLDTKRLWFARAVTLECLRVAVATAVVLTLFDSVLVWWRSHWKASMAETATQRGSTTDAA